MAVVLPGRLNAGPGKRRCFECLAIFSGLKEIQLSCIPDTEADCAGDSFLIADESDGVTALGCRGVAFGVCTEQIAKIGGGELIADALMDGCVSRIAGFDFALLVQCDRAEAIHAGELGVQSLVIETAVGSVFGDFGNWPGSRLGITGFRGDEVRPTAFGWLCVVWLWAS
ncbi:MAG: hypothetical protein RLZZ458_2514 [Planctomycetota bacterium]